jgi:hypothetical protein
MPRSSDGYLICQACGCDEPAEPWSYVVLLDSLELEVIVCPRHARELVTARSFVEADEGATT